MHAPDCALRAVLFAGLLTLSQADRPVYSSSYLPESVDDQVQAAAAVFRGTVRQTACFRDSRGHIYTRAKIRVDEVFKGRLPAVVALVHRGGTVDGFGEADGSAPDFRVGEERLLMVAVRSDGTLASLRGGATAFKLATPDGAGRGASSPAQDLLENLRARTAAGALPGADLTAQAATIDPLDSGPVYGPGISANATNLIVGTDNIPARFVLPDRGEPIPYLIDADYLPAGMTLTQAVTAVKTALAAWTNVSSDRYVFAGIQSFGQAAANVDISDGALRIQLHDYYNYTSGGGELGIGGHAWTTASTSTGWTSGGNVAGSDFHKVLRGYIVLQHTNVSMQTLSTFTEVLTHEIGHTIGLAHSSETYPEPNQFLYQAIMYYLVHADGRGASLNGHDINVISQIHPPSNTPPWAYDRVLDVVTSPATLSVPFINAVQLRGYDLQNAALTVATTDAAGLNGVFNLVNNNLTYVANGFFMDSGRLDPAANTYYDIVSARFSDGLNASPFITVRVLSFWADSYSEGIPDSWRVTYFGNADPSVGAKHHAGDDADGDGYSNLLEFWMGSVPTDAASNLRITSITPTTIQWQAKPYEVYEVLTSTNLTSWSRTINPVVPTNNPASLTIDSGSGRNFYRVVKVP